MIADVSSLYQNVLVLPTLFDVARAALGLPLLLLVMIWCWHHWKYRRVIAAASKLPIACRTVPFLGHLYLGYSGLEGILLETTRLAKKAMFDGLYTNCAWFGPYPIIFLLDPDDIYTLVTSSITNEKSNEYSLLNFALGNGLLIAPSTVHRITRRHINPMFQRGNLDQLSSVFNSTGRHLVQDLSKHVGRGHVDILEPVTKTSLRNISCFLVGADLEIDITSREFNSFYKAVEYASSVMIHRIIKPWLWSDAIFNFLWRREIDDINKSSRHFAELLFKELADKRKADKYTIQHCDKEIGEEPLEPITLISTYDEIRKKHEQFNDEYFHKEFFTLAITGTDSTKSALPSCLLAIAANPDIQERLYEEIVSAVGAGASQVTSEDINRMPYLDQVFKETLRYFVVIPFFLRKVSQDLQLKEIRVPAGASIAVNLIGLHYNPEVFPEPETFDPDHFSPEAVAGFRRYTFLPFSGGSRSCVGKVYAATFVKTVVIHVLRRYRLTTSVDITKLKFSLSLAMVSSSGYHMELHDRTTAKQ